MPSNKQKCGYCRNNFYSRLSFDEHEDACFEEYEAKEREHWEEAEQKIREFTDVGFSEEQAQLLLEKFGGDS